MIDEKKDAFATRVNGFFEAAAELYDKRPVLYYFVPPCPECGGRKTGRYVRMPLTKLDTRYVMDESLKHGELIRMVEKVPVSNAFCTECGAEWPEHIYAKMYPAWKVEKEKIIRNTNAKYAEFQINNPKKRPIWKKFTGFFS